MSDLPVKGIDSGSLYFDEKRERVKSKRELKRFGASAVRYAHYNRSEHIPNIAIL